MAICETNVLGINPYEKKLKQDTKHLGKRQHH